MSKEESTLFQKWIMLMLFNDINKTLSEEEIALQCCDSSLKTLEPSKIGNEIASLVVSKNVERDKNYRLKITPQGILYTRKQLIAPITEFLSDQDFQKNIEKLPQNDKTFLSNLRVERDKDQVTKRITMRGIQNIGALVNLVSAIINIISKIPSN